MRQHYIRLIYLLCLAAFACGPLSADESSSAGLTAEDKRSMQRESRIAIDALQDYHYKRMPFVEVDSRVLLTEYANSLDDQRMFLLQSDIDFIIERFERSLKPSYLFVGDLYPAFEIYDLYKERVSERLDWVAERIEGDFDFTTDATFNTDREAAEWPADEAEADALWEARLKFDLVAEMLEGQPLDRAKEKIASRYERRRKFLEEIEPHNVQEAFLTTLTERYDPHSQFFSWDSAQEFDIEISNALIGIGAQLRDIEGYCVIERVLPGGPAEQSGQLHPGDKIVAVSQGVDGEPVDVVGMKLRRIVHLIRGEQGTQLQLLIQPPGDDKRRTVTLTRDRIELSANLAHGEIFHLPAEQGSVPIGVIELPSFYGEGDFDGNGTSTSQDVHELINKFKEYDIEGLVLDLRQNGGGRLDEAIALTGLFIEQGPVVMKRSYDGNIEEDWDRDPTVAYRGPLVVLTSKLSASASEIMAGALQSYNRAIVVGDESTYGKGTVQTLVDLKRMVANPFWKTEPKWGMLKLTIQQFYLPDGSSTQKRGVRSDIVLPTLETSLIKTESEKENALEWDSIAPISFGEVEADWTGDVALVDEPFLAELRERSQARQESLPEFDFYKREVEWRKQMIEKDVYSLNLELRRAEKAKIESTRDAFEKERKSLRKRLGFEAEAVELTVAEKKEKSHQKKLRETPLPNGMARANHFYQKVFYYQEEPGSKIEEIWVEYIDYEEVLEDAEELAQVFSEASGIEVGAEKMHTILQHLKNADRGSAFVPMHFFGEVLGDAADPDAIRAGLSPFFRRIVELDEDILRDRPVLDIHLRESLRIVNDWIALASNEPEPATLVAKKAGAETESIPATAAN